VWLPALLFCAVLHIIYNLDMDAENNFYPDFLYPASQLSAYTFCLDVFIIALKNGEIVKFKPVHHEHFTAWLQKFNVRNIMTDKGYGSPGC